MCVVRNLTGGLRVGDYGPATFPKKPQNPLIKSIL